MSSALHDHFFHLLEQRIALLTSLADALAAARLEVVALDISGLEQRISEQARVCAQIRTLDTDLDRVQRQCANVLSLDTSSTHATAPDQHRLRDLLSRLTAIQSTVKQLNNAHQMLLRRSRRTANALLISYQSFTQTYSDPAVTHATVGERA